MKDMQNGNMSVSSIELILKLGRTYSFSIPGIMA